MCKVSARWCSVFLGASIILGIPGAALAQTSLTWAKVERLRNRVHLIPNGYGARLARVADVMSIGDALRTAPSARAELRFNDGSLARVGEQATFRFTPNTRNFQLSNGTVLLLIPPGRGRTTIQTPNAVTGIQGSALFVRVRCLAELSSEGNCSAPVTFVGALTNNPAGAMVAFNESGSQQQPIYAGEMIVIEGDEIIERLEFDLRTFYQTSGLVEGLNLDSPTPPEELSEDLQGVWQEIQDALELQGDFDAQGSAEEIVENPGFLAPTVSPLNALDSADSTSHNIFAGFPGFSTSPAAAFHNVAVPVVASQQSSETPTATIFELPDNDATLNTDVANARLGAVLGVGTPAPAPAPVAVVNTVAPPTINTPVTPAVTTTAPVNTPVTPVVTTTAPVNTPVTPVVTTTAPVNTPVTPVVTTTAPVNTPVTPVVTTTAPVNTPVTPVVTTTAPVNTPVTPVVTTTAPVDTPTNPGVPTLEADAIDPPERNDLSQENFNWDTPATGDPEVLQSSPNIDL
ncbi:FecR domain-containing protein [Leptolyngbya cf. ectocarpi LEGE 11479]|uniref:FecR domain-containing protein n=1 Tax=Leptolyngbya cf. ectocarpi LEGE 11479 TaxID=1828722 RepID=A0A928WZG4_LEPEC|nr:FecR family protein [Leptolyngbya ectocarpi]MBE9065076.1 FecR domain-containing protein [Leptolyngbya cf. ectocarpi LEGE 11479]